MSVRTSSATKARANNGKPAIRQRSQKSIIYPESDGKPMSDNTKQYDWITRIKGGLESRFNSDPKVFVAGDLLWYPVKGNPKACTAPDVMVVIGRPKGHRGSYRQWEEAGITPQVVFEIWSPSNSTKDKEDKLAFYQRYGVEEYYAYDPDTEIMEGWLRQGRKLESIAEMRDWKSPLLGVTFKRFSGAWNLYHPNGEPFVLYEEMFVQRDEARENAKAERAAKEAERAAKEAERAAKEAAWAKLRELGIDPETLK